MRPFSTLRFLLPMGLATFLAGGIEVRADTQGENQAPATVSITMTSGVAPDAVYSILQDRTGFLWLATGTGLYRYDGHGFEVFAHDPDDPASLAGNDVSDLLEDRAGFLWIGLWGQGLDRYDPTTGAFTHFGPRENEPGRLPNGRVQVLFEDSNGKLWAGTHGGLARYDEAGETFQLLRHDPDDPSSLSHDRVWAIAEDTAGDLWVGTDDGITILDRSTSTVKTVRRHDPENASSLSHDQVRALYVDRSHAVWAGTRSGLSRYDRVSGKFERFLTDPDDSGSRGGRVINVIFEDSRGGLWVGTREDGLHVFDRLKGTFEDRAGAPSPRGEEGGSLPRDVRALAEDRSRILWIGTREGGLGKLDLKPRKFQLVRHRPADPRSLRPGRVSSLAEDGNGRLWIATSGGLDRYDTIERRFVHLDAGPGIPGGLPGTDIHLLFVDRQDRLWVAVEGRGLSLYLGDGAAFRTFRRADGTLLSDEVTALDDDVTGHLWIGTDQGVTRFDRDSGQSEHFRHDPNDPTSLTAGEVSALLVDHQGVLWIGTDLGLDRFDADRDVFEHFRHVPGDETGLNDDRILTIHQEPLGGLWIGTGQGLCKVQGRDTFRCWAIDDARSPWADQAGIDPGVQGILSDTRGRLWLTFRHGMARFDPPTGSFRALATSAGFEGLRFVRGAALERRDGRMLFGGDRGFTCFHPDRVVDNPHVPPVVLSAFRVFGLERPLAGPLFEKRTIELGPDENFFSFELAALDFTAPEANRYRYRLEGFDRDWVEAGTNRRAVYTNVEPGEYVFRAQGANNDGVWNQQGLTVAVRVSPPWWGHLWIRILGVLLLMAAGAGLQRLWLARFRRREFQLKAQIEEGWRELRKSEARYRKLFERNLAGVVRATIDGRILDCNDAFARIFGYSSREECRANHQLDFGRDVDSQTMLDNLRHRGGYETESTARDGTSVTLLWNASVVLDETSEGLVIEGTVIDISERQRMEERLRREQKLESLEVLAGGIAHDFNNLLVGVLGNAELAREYLEPESPVHDYLSEIEKAAQRAATLSKKMLAYSGKGRFVTTNLDLTTTVEEALTLVKVPQHIELELRLGAALPSVRADATQLHQLLTNLIVNAVEAMGEDTGTLTLTTDTRYCDRAYLAGAFLDEELDEGRYVFVDIRDTGPGMDEETEAKIFDPFFTTKFPGRGLGLPVVLGIVRGHHGALVIESKPGRGTMVRVLLPATDELVEIQPVVPQADESWSSTGTVLLVDDEDVVRKIGRQMLERMGFVVLVAEDGAKGVELFRRHADEIVLVVLDLTMPRMSGEEVFHEIRALRPDAHILLASGYEEQEAMARFDGHKLHGFIQKPYQMAALRQKVKNALEAS